MCPHVLTNLKAKRGNFRDNSMYFQQDIWEYDYDDICKGGKSRTMCQNERVKLSQRITTGIKRPQLCLSHCLHA